MISLFSFQQVENSKAYQMGYEVGFFVGSNALEVALTAVVLLVAILYLLFFRKRRNNPG